MGHWSLSLFLFPQIFTDEYRFSSCLEVDDKNGEFLEQE
jgi:hypothetical protein